LASFLIAGGVGVYLFNDVFQTNIQNAVVHDLDVANVIYVNHMKHVENMVFYTTCFSRIIDPMVNDNHEVLRQNLADIYNERFYGEVDILTVVDKNGIVVARARNPKLYGDSQADNELIRHAINGATISSTQIITREDLLKENRSLADQAYMEFTPTPKAKPRPENHSTSGMAILVASPIYDMNGNIIGVLYGADLINRDYYIVDEIKNALYKDEIYGGRDVGTATIFQEDFRISTNVLTDIGERAITTRVSQEVNEAVLEKGEYWKGRAFVVNSWYVTAYKPIKNINGDIIGILYVGILEKPYIDAGYGILIIYILFLFAGFVLSIFVSRYYAGAIIRPINKLIKGTESIAKGQFEKIEVGTNDETAKLANAFNEMAIDLQKTMGELLLKRNEIETIFKSISDVASALDKDNRIIFTNNLANKIFGEDIYGEFCYKVFEGKDKICEDCPAIESLKSGEVVRVIHSRIDNNGKEYFFEITGSPLKDENDNVTGTLEIRRDVTEQKTLENQLRQSYKNLENAYNELQQMDKIKSELVANISHELRTPLTAIRGYTELMMDSTLGNITDMQKKSLAVVLRNIDRLTRLITNILDLSKFESTEHEISSLQLERLIDDVITDFEKTAKDKDITILKDVEANLTLEGDDDRLVQVFYNLLENAVKFSEKGGKISVKAYRKDADHIHIEVCDTGIGIANDQLDMIFKRFYQIDSSSTRKFGGTGLGLAICKKIIEWHNGTIWARSIPGKGSVFHIILPVMQPNKSP
jgi:PAS domain S-box-containing protein